MNTAMTHRAALGQLAAIGDLYDARTDNFCGISVFRNEIPIEAITLKDNTSVDVHLIQNDTFSEKFSKLDVKEGLQVSVLAGLVSPEGSGRYLGDQKSSARTVKRALLYSIKTKAEDVNIYQEELKNAFSIEGLESTEATHFVAGITWGANCILSCEYRNVDSGDEKEVDGNLVATLEKLSLSILSQSPFEVNQGNKNRNMKMEIRIFSDLLQQTDNCPATFEEALQTMKQMSNLVSKSNDGKGTPLTYRLIPLSKLRDHLNFPIRLYSMLRLLDVDTLLRVIQRFEQSSEIQQQINDLYQDVIENQFCVCPEEMVKIDGLKWEFSNNEARFRASLAKTLTSIRSGNAAISTLDNCIEDNQNGDFSPEKLLMQLTKLSGFSEKITFAKTLVENGGKYIGVESSLDSEIIKHLDIETFVLYLRENSKSEDPEKWNKTLQTFLQEVKSGTGCQYFAVDCDIHPELWPKCGMCIEVLQNGQIITENLLSDKQDTENFLRENNGAENFLRENKGAENFLRENKGAETFLRENNGTENSLRENKETEKFLRENKRTENFLMENEETETFLKNKREKENLVEENRGTKNSLIKKQETDMILRSKQENEKLQRENRGADNFVGESQRREDFLKKKQEVGNLLREKEETEKQAKSLLDMDQLTCKNKEMNILILGETGVGKSTWINGFINFVHYGSLKEAEENELHTLIPSKFTMYDDKNFEEIIVSTGSDKNEVQAPGQAATQSCKVYPFDVGDITIRLIDTPGIGDTRGYDQDKQNFQNILTTLSRLEELHGICILLKPNNARLTVMFRFCIKELLTYLHRDASRNIVFCFTNCRGTFYRPGDTMPALKALLQENKDVDIPISAETVYCYDSEAYRFLAAVKNVAKPVKFPEDERDNFSKSWTKSITETRRMLQHISTLKPHPIQSTLNLNTARELVVKLTRPLAEITKTTQTIKSVIKDKLEEIRRTEENIKELEKKKMCKIPQLKITKLEYPKTVCANKNCTKIVGTVTHYATICHHHCYLGDSVSADTLGDPGLIKCDAMDNGNCTVGNCRHSYREHLHAYYDSEEIMVNEEDETVKQLLKDNVSAAEMKQGMIKAKEREIAEYDQELKVIENASAQFACFLKHNAITPYNDAMLEYLDHLVRQEEDKVHHGGDRKTLELLRINRNSYTKEIEIIENAMHGAGKGLRPTDIGHLVKRLCELKHSGKTLTQALSAVEATQKKVFMSQSIVPGTCNFQPTTSHGWLYGGMSKLFKGATEFYHRKDFQPPAIFP